MRHWVDTSSKWNLIGTCVLTSLISFVPNSTFGGTEAKVPNQVPKMEETFFAKEKELVGKLLVIANDPLKTTDREQILFELAKLPREKLYFPEVVAYYEGLSALAAKDLNLAKAYFVKVRDFKPNFKLYSEASLKLAQILLEKKDWRPLAQLLGQLLKRLKTEESYPEVLYTAILVEKQIGHRHKACLFARKLYSRYPFATIVKDWGPQLHDAKVGDHKIGCVASSEDFEARIRNLQLSGNSSRALFELDSLRKVNSSKSPSYELESVYARYLLQEGEPKLALDTLLKYHDDYKDDFKYLSLLAIVAARAGQVPLAIGSYDAAFKLEAKSKKGIQLLFQSGFMCYQVRDYDGATRRFQLLRKKAPQTQFAVDAGWHLAWLQYLKSDYAGAIEGFNQLIEGKRRQVRLYRPLQLDRLLYWLAMSEYRMGHYLKAAKTFSELSRDPAYGYYSVAASQRLLDLKQKNPSSDLAGSGKLSLVSPSGGSYASVLPNYLYSSKSGSGAILPFDFESDFSLQNSQAPLASTDNELMANIFDRTDQLDIPATMGLDSNPDSLEIPDTVAGSDSEEMKDEPESLSSYEAHSFKAKFYSEIGAQVLAKWELFEIEKTHKSPQKLKKLISDYMKAGTFNRAAYLAQAKFLNEMIASGIQGSRELWKASYPRAFEDFVLKGAKEQNVPDSLIWGIMRAESMYKIDIVSPVGAIGLMQIMPNTADRLVKLSGSGIINSSDLFKPDISIRVGSQYLSRLAKKFNNSIPLVAGAYNAGPHRVSQWLFLFGYLDMDEFIEHIPFLETRNYVKRVASNVAMYSRLYGQPNSITGSRELKVAELDNRLGLELANPISIQVNEAPPTKEDWN